MANYIIKEKSDEGSTASNAIWAITAIIIVALIAGVAYYGFKVNNHPVRHDVDIKIEAPIR